MSDVGSYLAPPDTITKRLAKEERVIWWDRPRAALLARREVNLGFFSGLFLFAFALFWMFLPSPQDWYFTVFACLPLLLAFWMISAPLRAYYRAANLAFALTDRRALIVSRHDTKSFPLEQIDFVDTRSFAHGGGHVYFYKEPMTFASSPFYHPGGVQKSGFLAIGKVEQVSATLLDLIERRRSSGRVASASTRG